jgi:hypothetical protein
MCHALSTSAHIQRVNALLAALDGSGSEVGEVGRGGDIRASTNRYV